MKTNEMNMRWNEQSAPLIRWTSAVFFSFLLLAPCWAQLPPARPLLPAIDKRHEAAQVKAPPAQKSAAVGVLRQAVPSLKVEFEPVTGSARSVSSTEGFLTGPEGKGATISAASLAGFAASDPHRVTKAFLTEHRALFGHGPEALAKARISRDYIASNNGLHTAVWEQQVDGIAVFEGVLISHTTRKGELVNLSSQFVADPESAATLGTPNRAALVGTTALAASRAVALAAQNVEVDLQETNVVATGEAASGAEQRQKFTAPGLKGEAEAKLIWLPMNAEQLRLCWDVVLMNRQRGEMFRVLLDVESGEVLVRRCLTSYLTDATYNVFTSDSPSPFSPGWPTPNTNQPPSVSRTLVTLPALDTNASPAGWINDGANQTWGNNVDAHTDRNADNSPDLPRPQGSPFRVFDFPMNLTTQDPTNYASAAVVQLFYLCNWYHDKMYQLGFTEAAGNFQSNNFARGGLGNDAVLADAQDGSGTNNANFSTPPDGSPGRMQMYIFTSMSPRRDGDLDAEIVLHEYTHGLSWRLVGGGQGLGTTQSDGMGEGWSDFYGMALLSEAGDNVNGNYAAGAYASYKLSSTFLQNYYFGIRRYPYTTDMSKNPLTFKDIDPAQADYCSSGAPFTGRTSCSAGNANEVHNSGEVWCVTLWEARANLITKFGWAVGNQLILQLVTDGMKLTPMSPNFLQARDAILQADLVDTGGANRNELWAAFAKRGLGYSATSPASSTTTGIHESFDIPDDLRITPAVGFVSRGPVGGPFDITSSTLTLTNAGTNSLNWSLVNTSVWLNVSPTGGTLIPGGAATQVTASMSASATSLPMGVYSTTVSFTNLTSGVRQGRLFTLRVGQPDFYTELFDNTTNDLAFKTFTFTPDGSSSFYSACWQAAASFPTDPTGGTNVSLSDDSYTQVTLTGTNTVAIYNTRTNVFFIGSNGYLNMNSGDTTYVPSYTAHFNRPRVSGLFRDLNPGAGGAISWKQLSDRIAVTYLAVPVYGSSTVTNSFQFELFFDGGIRLTCLAIKASDGLAGLSAGTGVPANFEKSDLTSYGSLCSAPVLVTVPTIATEGNGVLVGAGQVRLPAALATNLNITLSSSDTTEVTVPASVTILAGQTNVAFDLTIVDDVELDGTQTATISASAPGYNGGSATILVFDNESATLLVSLPASVSEGAGTVQGMVQVSAAPTANVTVSLSSSDTTEIQVPASVLIPAGQTSVVFTATVVDDNLIDGSQTATVTAHVQNWTDGSAAITVLDNESLNLTVTLPASATEGDGVLTNAGRVWISGTLPTSLIVSLASSNVVEVTVPASVLIPAGQLFGAFNLTIGHDPAVTGNQTVIIAGSAPGFVTGSNSMIVKDYEIPPLLSNPTPANLASNVAANISLSWTGGSGDVTNDVYFGTNPTPGPAQLVGSTTNMTWTLPLLSPNTTYYWQIVSHRVGTTTGPVWRFTTRGVDHFVWSSIASPQFRNVPFGVTIAAQDELGRSVTNFAGSVGVAGMAGNQAAALFNDNFEDGDISDWINDGGTYTRSVVTDTAAGGTHSLTLIGGTSTTHYNGISHLLSNLQPSQVVFYVRASTTTAAGGYCVLGTGTLNTQVAVFFYMNNNGTMGIYEDVGGWHSVPYSAQQWYKITLAFDWALKHVDFYVNDVLATANIPFRGSTVASLSRVWLYNFDSTQNWWDEIQFAGGNFPAPVSITPTNSGGFVNGFWTGNITVQQLAANMYLRADDGFGHTGNSTNFTVLALNDLILSMTAAPNPVTAGRNWTNTIAVTNTGPAAATGVFVTNVFPVSAAFVSAAASQGSFTIAGNVVTFNAGSMSGGASATFNIVVAPSLGGIITNVATVTRAEADGEPSNNSATTTTLVQMPTLAINNVSTLEGNSGFTPFIFTVQLSPASPTNVTVNFATADGTAQAGSDYVAASGTLAFLPGQTNQTLTVQVIGDTNAEPNETFSVVLSSPVNAALGTAVGTGTILNDDMGPFFDDFEPDVDLIQWSAFGGVVGSTVLATNYGGYVSGPNSLWFGAATNRHAASRSLNAIQGGVVDFWLRIASGTSSTWETADLPGEGIVLEYSVNSGSSWVEFGRYDTSTYTSWTHLTVDIPLAAQTVNTQFRWRQLSNSGSGFDHWALDDVGVVAGLRPPSIATQPTSQAIPAGSSATFCVTATGSLPLRYFWMRNGAAIAGATNSCYTTNNIQLPDSGTQFSCLVSNLYGTILSSNATLTVLSSGGTNRIVLFSLDTDPSWTRQGEWAFGVPAGQGGTAHGFRDPANGTTGTNVFGINLSGDYANTVGGPYYLTAGPFNFSGYSGVALRFQRWLNTDYQPYVYATIDVSTNGLVWSQVWSNATTTIADTNWLQLTYNLSAYADHQPVVYVRWGHEVRSSGAFAYSGWNLDDIEFLAVPGASNPPAITTQPANQTVAVGGTATFSISATGSTPLGYFWKRNGSFVYGATNATYTTNNVQLADTGSQFSCLVSNAYGTALSSNATLSVTTNIPPETLMPLPPHQTTYVGNARGFWFTAPTSFVITGVEVPAEAGTGNQSIAVVRFNSGVPPAYPNTTNDFTVLFLTQNNPSTGRITANILVTQDDWIGVMGVRGDVNSYGAGPYTSDILGTPVTLTRMGMQYPLSSTAPQDLWQEPGGSISRVMVYVSSATPQPPIITSQPTNQAVAVGGTAAFSVTVSGTAPLSYFWRRNGSFIAGATNSTYSTNNVQVSDSGTQFSCLVSNAYGSATSSNAVLTVFPVGVVQQNFPSSNSIVVASTGFLDATQIGYFWSASRGDSVQEAFSTSLPSITGATFDFVVSQNSLASGAFVDWNVRINGALVGNFRVGSAQTGPIHLPLSFAAISGPVYTMRFEVTNEVASGGGSIALGYAGINAGTVLLQGTGGGTAPSITSQPASQTVPVGSSATFCVTATGSPPLSYFWRRNGTAIAGANASCYTTNNVQLADSGSQFSCVVSNAYGTALSSNGTLTVNAGIATSVLLLWDVNSGGTLALSNALANAGISVTLSATDETGYNGANPSPTGFGAVVHLNGTTYGTDMPMAGQIALSNYVQSGGGYIQNEWDAYEYGAGTMANMRDLILFDRISGNNGSVTLTNVTGQAGHPVLANVPSSFTFQAGFNVGSAHVFSTNPVTVLMRQGTNDAVAVRQFGLGRIVGFHHAGNYEQTSGFNTLSDVNVQQLYINAVRWVANHSPVTQVAVFDNPLYVDTTSGGVLAESDNVQSSLTNLGYAVLTFTNITSGVAGQSVVLIPELENGDLAAALTVPERTALQNFVQGGGTLVIHGSYGSTRTANLINTLLGTSVAELTETTGTVYTRSPQSVGTTFAGNTNTLAAMNGSDYLTTASLPAGALSIYTNSTRTLVAVLPSGAGRVIFMGWDWYDAAPIGSQNGGWLQVLASAVNFGVGIVPQPPTITVQPSNQTIALGGTATFSVAATGTAPLSYFWRRNGSYIAGATNSIYTTNNVQLANSGSQFSCVVSNAYGTAISQAATLTVVAIPPVITLQPTNQTVVVGATASFVISASGSPPLSYFWRRNGSPISGAISSSYNLTNAQVSDSGSQFSCVVTNIAGSVTSSVAVLKVDTTVANDQCGAALVIAGMTYTNAQYTTNATSTGDPAPDCVSGFGNGVWYRFTPAFSGQLEVDTFGSDFDTGLAIYTGACGSWTQVACNDDTGGLTSQVNTAVSAGTTYYILAGGYSGYTGHLLIHLALTLPVDHFAWNTIPSPKSKNVPFGVMISAQNVNNQVVANFTGTAMLGGRRGGSNIVFSANFDSGSDGFIYVPDPDASSNLWHSTSHRFVSPTNCQYYGREGSWNYDTGARNAGNLQSPVISLAGAAAPVTLSFKYLLQTEGGTTWDQATLAISADGGTSWIALISSTNLLNPLVLTPSFTNRVVDISAYAGSNIVLRFNFDTIDAGVNTFEGWYVDDVSVTATTAAVAITPTNTGSFISGVWTGNVAVLETAANLYLVATDNLGHSGSSNPFQVVSNSVITRVTLLPGGNIQITLAGSSGDIYRVQGSTNLLSWQTIASVTNITGTVQFTDPTATNYSRRFYRLAMP